MLFHVQPERLVRTDIQWLDAVAGSRSIEVETTGHRADRQHEAVVGHQQWRVDLFLCSAECDLRHLRQHLGVTKGIHGGRAPVPQFIRTFQPARHHIREFIKAAFRQHLAFIGLQVVTRKRFIDLVDLALVAVVPRHDHMHDGDLFVGVTLFRFENLVAYLVGTELIDRGAGKHSELAVDRIDASLLIFRQETLGNVPGGEAERRVLVGLDQHHAGPEQDQVVV